MKTCFFLFSFFIPFLTTAQGLEEIRPGAPETEKEREKRHLVSGLLGYSILPSIDPKGVEEHRLIPTFGLAYGYRFSRRFVFSLNAEVEIGDYLLVERNESEIEREYPVLLTGNAIFEPVEGLGLKVGAGIEFEPNRNFFIFQAGLEYLFELPNNWLIGPELLFITKDGQANGGSFGLGFGKKL